MRIIYYGFGGFIGLICGTIINLIFYWVEKSGHPIISSLPRKYGAPGYYLAEMTNYLPLFGAGLGLILVKWLFQGQWSREAQGGTSGDET